MKIGGGKDRHTETFLMNAAHINASHHRKITLGLRGVSMSLGHTSLQHTGHSSFKGSPFLCAIFYILFCFFIYFLN